MPSNVEIKAKVENVEKLEQTAAELSDTPKTILLQEDTFFRVPNGRLKLRQIQEDERKTAELIFYERPDQAGPKCSHFNTTQITDPESLKVTLGNACGVVGIVKKERVLYMIGQTRVHIDKVDQLGNFMELEFQMKDNQSIEEGERIADDLMSRLGIRKEHLITCAYMDLILKQNDKTQE